jgi:hypothetical protein
MFRNAYTFLLTLLKLLLLLLLLLQQYDNNMGTVQTADLAEKLVAVNNS